MVRSTLGLGRPVDEHVAEYEGRVLRFDRVSMGNPHAILFDAPLDTAYADRVGSAVSAALGGSNVEFVQSAGQDAFDVVVWERGVGRTLACGTGAAAVAVSAVRSGRAQYDRPLEIRLPGGPLEVTVRPETLEVFARGPARRVFEGRLL
jgi:diaminopimelate epimerase